MEKPYFIENLIQEFIANEKSRYNGTAGEFEEFVKQKMDELQLNVTNSTLEEIYNFCMDDEKIYKKWEVETKQKIIDKYGFGIKIFEAFIELNIQISTITYNKYYSVFENIEDQVKLDTLIALHVRACQVASEVKTLVANGFSDGGHARWRTLHEICITFLFLYDSDYETIYMYNPLCD